MKNIKVYKRVIALIFALAIILTAAGCTQGGDETADGKTPAAANGVADINDGVVKIALLINGDLGDMSFWDSANAGMLRFRQDYPDAVVDIIEMGSSDTTKYESTLTQTANKDYDLIIVGTTDMREALQRLVKKEKYADRRFIIFDTEIVDGKAVDYPTVHSIMFKQNEGGFLAGVLAAVVSDEAGAKNTAFIGGSKNDIINDFGYGFMQGVAYVNADKGRNIGAYNSYIGDFTNSPKGSSLATGFYDNGVEILFAAASQAGLGCIDAAKNNEKLIIGVDSDQYAYYSASDPEKAACVVSSVLKRVDLALYDCCRQFVEGTLSYGDLQVLGISDGMIGLVLNENYESKISQSNRDYVAAVTEKLLSGEIAIESGLKRYTTQETLNQLFDSLDPTK